MVADRYQVDIIVYMLGPKNGKAGDPNQTFWCIHHNGEVKIEMKSGLHTPPTMEQLKKRIHMLHVHGNHFMYLLARL